MDNQTIETIRSDFTNHSDQVLQQIMIDQSKVAATYEQQEEPLTDAEEAAKERASWESNIARHLLNDRQTEREAWTPRHQ